MTIYLVLVLYLLVLPVLCQLLYPEDQERNQQRIAFWGMLAIFLLLTLKSTSVGIDIAGYEHQYKLAQAVSWNNWNYVYFENGYIFLEKLFSKSHVPFRIFLTMVYGVECSAWYLMVRRHSKDACLSLLFFVCYQTFVFSCSGLRQALALGLCIMAFLLHENDGISSKIAAAVLTLFAITVHQSAISFLTVPAAYLWSKYYSRPQLHIMVLMLIFAFIMRNPLLNFTNTHIREIDTTVRITFGGSFFLMLMLFFFALFTVFQTDGNDTELDESSSMMRFDNLLSVRFLFLTILGYVLFSGGKLLRAIMYVTSFVPIYLPGLMERYQLRIRTVMKFAMIVFLVVLFYVDTLAPNQLHIIPYRFFWE